ncbi:Uncharacterised protein [Anaerococcus prevotii]|uniref:Uncharacterized protein n=1 Tax=Anaerococcus prevotii (strain ATCC 9321 / DSM 20548 / JCM 6508 / NCTC 11806 / PC1) TaxID=525919 RepID=C7RE25_ANAPD|nr:hypothetical protein [Anaerococcus prevotii]ACV29438.1 hypothetical protein Apre_1415 [Anaerococcus prevotii DSM 20548]SUU95110.1 Uncharacterised protein [Anaerococcus prevotii]SUV24021.1 Uncharacterised protein [Anaerococcus prevotii]SUV24023.1 Uncharacterised protein [Anaerococcus prevotii]
MKEKTLNEIKAISLFAFLIGCGYYLREGMEIYYLIVTILFVYLDSIFINKEGLFVSKHIFYLLLAIYNVISLAFMIQYIRGDKLDDIFLALLKPFLGANEVYFVGLILIFTTGLIIKQNIIGANNGKE